MAHILEKAISILAGNLNLGLSYLITTVLCTTTCVSFAGMDIEDHTQYSQGVEREDFRLYK